MSPERYLAWIEVDHKWHRRGLGTELLKRLTERAHEVGAQQIFISRPSDMSYRSAHAFLRNHGFEVEGDVDHDQIYQEIGLKMDHLSTAYILKIA